MLVAGGVALTSSGMAYASQGKPDPQPTKRAKGTVKIHQVGTPVEDRRNEPHVCEFYLDAFGFDPGQVVEWKIVGQAPTKGLKGTSGTLMLGPDGNAHTDTIRLPDGHYKLDWQVVGDNGDGKHKVFWVECEADEPTPTVAPSVPERSTVAPSVPEEPTPSMTPSAPVESGESAKPTAPTGQTDQGSGLAKTGFTGGLLALAGVGVLAAGSAALLVARRTKH